MRGRVFTALVHPGYRAAGAAVLVALAAWVAVPRVTEAPVPIRQVSPTAVAVVRHADQPNWPGYHTIVVSTSTDISSATTSFSPSIARYYCLANLPGVPLTTPITWEWQRVQGTSTTDLFAPLTFTYPTVIRYAFADGPYEAGHYRCIVKASGTYIGSVDFRVGGGPVRPPEHTFRPVNDRIVASTSTDPSNATTSFSPSTTRYYCLANLPDVPVTAPITSEWQRVQGNTTTDLFAPLTFTYPTTLRYGYADGPYQAGHYRCIVRVKDKLIGSADFTTRSS